MLGSGWRPKRCPPKPSRRLQVTDMSELVKRKQTINLSIVHVDPDAFLDSFLPWLEITCFLSAHRTGQVEMPEDGVTPPLSAQQLAGGLSHQIGDDTLQKRARGTVVPESFTPVTAKEV